MANLILFYKTNNLCKSIINTSTPESIVLDDDVFSIEILEKDLNLLKDTKGVIYYNDGNIETLSKPNRFYEFNPVTKQFEKNAQFEISVLSDEIRDLRLYYLQELDAIVQNPLRYAGFIDEYKTKLAEYRQLLLDIPQQSGFPLDVIFPTLPQQ
jgi:hypothetical protein